MKKSDAELGAVKKSDFYDVLNAAIQIGLCALALAAWTLLTLAMCSCAAEPFSASAAALEAGAGPVKLGRLPDDAAPNRADAATSRDVALVDSAATADAEAEAAFDGAPATDAARDGPDGPETGARDAENEAGRPPWDCTFARINSEDACDCRPEKPEVQAAECPAVYACCARLSADICRCSGPVFCLDAAERGWPLVATCP
ncbi:MAG: hypothetical protein DWQ35_00410 [Planctomycetota bacterium]|nr:MAG: hypothetical protein DWQ35_00410 [Planctomycetota bacterium]